MGFRQWFYLTGEARTDYFRRAAFQNGAFIADTGLVGLIVAADVISMVKYWTVLPAGTILWGCAVILTITLFWARSVREHGRINRLFLTGSTEFTSSDQAMNAVARSAAALIHLGIYSLAAGGMAFSWQVQAIGHLLHR